jgi:hypothetical protein
METIEIEYLPQLNRYLETFSLYDSKQILKRLIKSPIYLDYNL